ncbi:MAG: DMT family transporter [Arenicellales bacterium]|jgi:drug/metabolite transporter (DMT)-like permease
MIPALPNAHWLLLGTRMALLRFRSKSSVGIALMIGAMMIVPFMDALAKLLSSRYPVLQLVWARFFFHFLLVFPIAWVRHRGHVFRAPRPVLQIGRGLCLMGATLCFFGAIRTIPLADAIALIFFDAVLVVLLSALLLNERVPTGRAIASVLGLVGVVLIVQPGFGNFQWESLLALAAAFFFALYFLSTRLLSGNTPPIVMLAWQGAGGFVVMSVLVPFIWVTPSALDLGLMMALGMIGAAGHLLLIRAFEYAEASLLAPFLYTEIVMQVLLGYWLFGDLPNRWAVGGIAIIVAVGVYLSLRPGHKSG